MSATTTTSLTVFACHSRACAPPPTGTGGSAGGSGGGGASISARAGGVVSRLQSEISGNKLARIAMPQIPGHAQSEFLDHLKAQGITHKRETIDPRSVQATQNQLNPTKVMRAVQGLRSGSLKKGAVVSSDNKIIDGHHQWAAVQVLGRRLDVVRINAPASRVMAEANRFAQYHGIKNKSA